MKMCIFGGHHRRLVVLMNGERITLWRIFGRVIFRLCREVYRCVWTYHIFAMYIAYAHAIPLICVHTMEFQNEPIITAILFFCKCIFFKFAPGFRTDKVPYAKYCLIKHIYVLISMLSLCISSRIFINFRRTPIHVFAVHFNLIWQNMQ